MINIIPMAGRGSRFTDEGYLLPKPLIAVSGKPMITRVIERLPKADKWIFVVRQDHIEQFAIDTVLREAVPDAIIVIDPDPQGQAASCMHALKHVADDDEIFISPCDSSQLYDEKRFDALRTRLDVDAIVWSFTDDDLLEEKPTAWGWLKLENDSETIADVSVKVPVSENPRRDHAVTANFYFKRASDFKAAYEKMTAAEHKINGEYYVDAMPIFLRQLGKKSVIFDVDLYVGWGKPSDLHLYELREYQYRVGMLPETGVRHQWDNFFASL